VTTSGEISFIEVLQREMVVVEQDDSKRNLPPLLVTQSGVRHHHEVVLGVRSDCVHRNEHVSSAPGPIV